MRVVVVCRAADRVRGRRRATKGESRGLSKDACAAASCVNLCSDLMEWLRRCTRNHASSPGAETTIGRQIDEPANDDSHIINDEAFRHPRISHEHNPDSPKPRSAYFHKSLLATQVTSVLPECSQPPSSKFYLSITVEMLVSTASSHFFFNLLHPCSTGSTKAAETRATITMAEHSIVGEVVE